MSHDLEMNNSKQVISIMDDCITIIKTIAGTIEITADISKMNLKIGGLDKAFESLHQIESPLSDALKTFETIKSDVESAVASFAAANENLQY